MAEVSIHYTDLQDRQIKGKEQEALGLRMLHDNFDADWKSGDEPHGTMIFTDVIPPNPLPPPDYKKEWQLATTQEGKIAILAKMVGLT